MRRFGAILGPSDEAIPAGLIPEYMKEVNQMTFNETLIKRRKEVGMTQDDLAEKLGVSRQSVSKWENGECMPDSEKLIKLAEVLEISLDELTGRAERKPAPASQAPAAAPEQPKSKLLPYILAAAACLVIGAACFLAGKYLFPYESHTADAAAPTAAPTETPTAVPTVTPAAAPTPAPTDTQAPTDTPKPTFRPDRPSKDELNEHDYNAVLAWLEKDISYGTGVKNGDMLNPDYDPDDPSTWFYEREGIVYALAEWDEEGYLTAFTALVENLSLSGNIDLSGCERLDYVAISDYNLGSLDLTGCPLGKGLWLSETSLYEILPEPLEVGRLVLQESCMEHLHWKPSGFELTLDMEDHNGSVGVITYDDEDYIRIYIAAYPDPATDGLTFVGWFDADGRLVSTEREFELTSLGTNGVLTGAYAFTARFK